MWEFPKVRGYFGVLIIRIRLLRSRGSLGTRGFRTMWRNFRYSKGPGKGSNMGASIVRIGFGGILYHKYITEPPK